MEKSSNLFRALETFPCLEHEGNCGAAWRSSAAFLKRHKWNATTHSSAPCHDATFSDSRYLPCRKTCLGEWIWPLPELQISGWLCIPSPPSLRLVSCSERASVPMPFKTKALNDMERIVDKQCTELWTRSTLSSMNYVLQVKKTALSHCAHRYDGQDG